MSAFVGLCRADCVELMTDGASIDRNDTLITITNKAFILPRCPAAMTARGNAKVIEIFQNNVAKLFADAGSFDDGMELVEEGLPSLRDWPKGVPHFEMLLCGISETMGPQMVYLVTHSYKPNVEACRLYVTGPGTMNAAGVVVEDEAAQKFASVGLEACGMPFLEGMRQAKSTGCFEDVPPRYAIGGHIDLTVITAAGATTRRVHNWPDRIGEKIDPFAEAHTAALRPPMSRQQRRAAEREARKRSHAR